MFVCGPAASKMLKIAIEHLHAFRSFFRGHLSTFDFYLELRDSKPIYRLGGNPQITLPLIAINGG